MRPIVLAFAILFVGACGGDSTGPGGALRLGIVSGNNQTVAASNKQLTSPVVGKLVRSSDGSVSFHWTDAILPRAAYAQTGTIVTGSPVPGAVVCAVSVDPTHPLTPFVPCTNTDSAGQATFFFNTSTTAGLAKAEIRGTIENLPAVFDTAKATILADVPDPNYRSSTTNPLLTSPAIIPENAMVDQYGNPIPFRIVSDTIITVQDATVGSVGARTLTFTKSTSTTGSFTENVTELRGANGQIIGHFVYAISSSTKQMQWRSVGSAITP